MSKKVWRLKPGDRVRAHYGHGSPYNGMSGIVTDVEEGFCESGWMIETDFTDKALDMGWFIPIDENGNDLPVKYWNY